MRRFARSLLYASAAALSLVLATAPAADGFLGPLCLSASANVSERSLRTSAIFARPAQAEITLTPAPLVRVADASHPATAATSGPAIAEPPRLAPSPRTGETSTPLTTSPTLSLTVGPPREVEYDLDVTYANGEIWNPTTQRYDKVRLRSYQSQTGAPPSFIAPAIEVHPGQTVRLTLHNNLPSDSTCGEMGGSANTPNCFNGTNLHSHGLWVNPAGNGDNVLLSINPNVSFQYEYNIPPTHPAGTFWYHSHRHGSTALQVSSGMAGALIVRGSRLPTPRTHGDLDTLLKPIAGQPFPERTLVFQQIQYACRDRSGAIERNADRTYKCDPGEVGGVEAYDQFGPGTWVAAGRFTSINGAVLGHLDNAVVGRIERWRMIHGGVRDTIAFQLRRLAPSAASPTNLTAAEAPAFVAANCTSDPLPVQLVAADGLTLAAARAADQAVLQPGYRWDALVVFPEAGDYCMINDLAGASASVNQNERGAQILGFVHVEAGAAVAGKPADHIAQALVAAAQAHMPAPVRDLIVDDLKNGMKLTRFTPHADVADSEITGRQTLEFNINLDLPRTAFFQIDKRPYDPHRVDRALPLGGVDEWTLTSNFVSHPYHIHVNPFQIVKIIAPDGKTDVSEPGAVDNFARDDKGAPVIDPQYPGLKGLWKDTLYIKNVAGGGGKSGQYTVVVRTRYERYVGAFVLHCHILDHEDQGMMQNVVIGLPDGKGGVAMGH